MPTSAGRNQQSVGAHRMAAPMMICVINGSEPWRLAKTFGISGMKKVSSTVSTMIASTNRMHG
jgi:hypothetical protein